MSVVEGTLSFDNSRVSARDGALRVTLYLDSACEQRHVQYFVLGRKHGVGGPHPETTAGPHTTSAVEDEPFHVDGHLRAKYHSVPPAGMSLRLMAEIQRLNDDASCPRWCWVESGVGRVVLAAGRGEGDTVRVPLASQTAGGLVATVVTVKLTRVTLSGGQAPHRHRGRLILPGLGMLHARGLADKIGGSIVTCKYHGRNTPIGGLPWPTKDVPFAEAAAEYVRACAVFQSRLPHTDQRTRSIRCVSFPGEVSSDEDGPVPGRIPACAAILGEAPYTSVGWWAEQVRQVMQRGVDTWPRGIMSDGEWAEATPATRAEFCTQLVANVIQLLPYMTDNADRNERGAPEWDPAKLEATENFAPLLCDGSGDCEDVSRSIALLKHSLAGLGLDAATDVPPATLAILRYASTLCRAYAAFLVLCSVSARNVKEGHAQPADDDDTIGAHMTLVWVKRSGRAMRVVGVDHAGGGGGGGGGNRDEPQWPDVMITEGTGPLSTTLRATSPPGVQSMLDRIGKLAPQLAAPIVHRWIGEGGQPNQSPFFRDAQDAHTADLLGRDIVDGGNRLSFYVMSMGVGGRSYKRGAPIAGMLAGVLDWALLPWQPVDGPLLMGLSEALRGAPPPPPMVLPSSSTQPSESTSATLPTATHHDAMAPVYDAFEASMAAMSPPGGQAGRMTVGTWVYLNDTATGALDAILAGVRRVIGQTRPSGLTVDRWPINAHLGCVHRVEFHYS